jgi:hypothetical protein
MTSLLLKKSLFRFSEEKKPNKFIGFLKSAWQQTFPEEEVHIKNKYQKVK